jgi:hypothetical protein
LSSENLRGKKGKKKKKKALKKMVVQWVVMLVIPQILVLECKTSILLYSKIISPLEI